VHTFKLLTKEGKETYIKWHWISKQGAQVIPPSGIDISTLQHLELVPQPP
jgi:catalase